MTVQQHNKNFSLAPTLGLVLCLLFGSCINGAGGGNKGNSRTAGRVSTTVNNNNASVPVGYGRALQDNPIILSNNKELPPTVDLNTLLRGSVDLISTEQTLSADCKVTNGSSTYTIPTDNSCYKVQLDQNSVPWSNSERKWAYKTATNEFLQAHTFFHQNKMLKDRYLTEAVPMMYGLSTTTSTSFSSSSSSGSYTSSIPSDYLSGAGFWMSSDGVDWNTLMVYPGCDQEDNAYFSASNFSLCYGFDKEYNQVKFAHDPTIIYHETGHALIYTLSNTRNILDSSVLVRVNPGYNFYDEAGALNEGWADWFSYYVNQRKHFAEWALGRFLNASRPITEDDDLHIAGISSSRSERLSYPTYLTYEPNESDKPIEDIHNAGMIASHFLVAFTETLKSKCSLSHANASNTTLSLIHETLAFLGDLTAIGSDSYTLNAYTPSVNLNSTWAYDWHKKVNPINYRRFFQTFARYAYQYINNPSSKIYGCSEVTADTVEQLLDDYGLLLFDSYNEDGQNVSSGHTGPNKYITITNRLRSVLIDKSLIKFDPTVGAPQAYVVDARTDVMSAINAMKASGQITEANLSGQIYSDLRYNNGNSEISPGEIVGIALNLYNASNSPMAGIQVLANDWDHVKRTAGSDYGKICNNFEDAFPLSTEGGLSTTEGAGASDDYCNYITRDNGSTTSGLTTPASPFLAPICFVQIKENNSSKWVLQNKLKDKIGLDDSDCLSGASYTEDCFVRAIKGADSAWYSKIDPNKTWGKTLAQGNTSPVFNTSNMVFFEVSPWIPPGTTFSCRFRVRFTNCYNCWHDESSTNLLGALSTAKLYDDYLDYEFSGNRPFKLLNFQFTVVD